MRILIVLVLATGASVASAGTHVMSRGETLERVAQLYGCTTEALLRANRLRHVLVPAGTVVRIPACSLRSRARSRERIPARARRASDAADDPADELERARRALTVIGGATLTAAATAQVRDDADGAQSIGQPWNGRLHRGERLPPGDGYRIRRPQVAFGASHVVEHLRGAIAAVRALHPDVHTLAIGDLSDHDGGTIANHHSHQSGLDVDVGFYYHAMPAGYPARFAPATDQLDLAAMWALIAAFARTTHLASGVDVIFLDHAIQARLHAWARQRGTPEDQLAALLQYPRSASTLAGLVRHWPQHADHLHVRFKPGR